MSNSYWLLSFGQEVEVPSRDSKRAGRWVMAGRRNCLLESIQGRLLLLEVLVMNIVEPQVIVAIGDFHAHHPTFF